MKKLTIIFSLCAIVFAGNNLFAQDVAQPVSEKNQCDVSALASPLVKTRGKNAKIKINFKKGEIKMLAPKVAVTRGKAPACMFSLYNYNEQVLHVYADSVYIGSIRPNSVGVVESLKSYQNVYVVNQDENLNWNVDGSCNCIHVFHLREKEGEGVVND